MSAAVQVTPLWSTARAISTWKVIRCEGAKKPTGVAPPACESDELVVHRRHTEEMLRRYLYASMLVGRAPSLLKNADGRGMVSHCKNRTFEDAVIFVLDMENCLKELSWLERELLSRIVLQEYTLTETASILRLSVRRVVSCFDAAVDRLTRKLLDKDLLVIAD